MTPDEVGALVQLFMLVGAVLAPLVVAYRLLVEL